MHYMHTNSIHHTYIYIYRKHILFANIQKLYTKIYIYYTPYVYTYNNLHIHKPHKYITCT